MDDRPDDDRTVPAVGKPPYRVPSMVEVAAVPWNGLTVATTFAGCGGSSLGYRMAGYRVLWANEFVPAAQESYAANMAPGTVLDRRDVKVVEAVDVLRAAGLREGELDVLDGSPPCQAFSTAGKRHKNWGKEREYEHGAKQRNEDLFFEYARLLRGLRPRAFVAENVSGLVKGVAKGYFLDILAELKGCGYRVEARLLDAQWLGVPQSRQRIIFVGAREDLGLAPAFPRPLPYRYSVREAIPWMSALRVAQGSGNGHSSARGEEVDRDAPSPTVITKQNQFVVEGAVGFDKHKSRSADEPMASVMAGRSVFVVHDDSYGRPEDITDKPSRTVRAGRRGTMHIEGTAIGKEYDRLNPGQQSNKYFNLVRADAGEPSPTVTGSGGGSRATACVVHPTEKRKFTIAELKRVCAFPDDFVLTGSYAQQWERLGNSVPPIMMRAVAEALRDRVLLPARARTAERAVRSPVRSTSARRRKGAGSRRPRPRQPRPTRTSAGT